METERARELLAEERERVERDLSGLGRQDAGEVSDQRSPADEATDVFEDERDEGLAESLRETLAAIERAEQRIEDGTYGRSVESGEPIPDERLEAIPWAERTTEEQRRFERSG